MKIYKTKTGEKIDIKEFIKRFKKGIESITPLQRLQNETRATFIMLIGYLVGLVSLVIYRELFVVQWFTYALIIIFLGATYGQVIKLFAFRTQLKLFKGIESKSIDLDKIFDNLEEEKIVVDGEQKGMDSQAIKVEKYLDEKVDNAEKEFRKQKEDTKEARK